MVELHRRKLRYYITSKKIIYEYTFLSNNVSRVNYSKIQDIHLKQNLSEKYLEIGNIEINTAGSDKIELKLKGVKKPVKIKNLIEKYLHKGKREKKKFSEDNLDKIGKLHKLLKKGIITKAEFDQKKKKLLG